MCVSVLPLVKKEWRVCETFGLGARKRANAALLSEEMSVLSVGCVTVSFYAQRCGTERRGAGLVGVEAC